MSSNDTDSRVPMEVASFATRSARLDSKLRLESHPANPKPPKTTTFPENHIAEPQPWKEYDGCKTKVLLQTDMTSKSKKINQVAPGIDDKGRTFYCIH